jgi:hypothetical protein
MVREIAPGRCAQRPGALRFRTRKESRMTQAIERQLTKARSKRRTSRPADAILILCDRPEDVPRRVDVLIAAGNLAEADRPRCVFCDDDTIAAMTHEQTVDLLDLNETAEDRRRIIAESAARAKADLAACIAAAEKAKSDSADRL